MHIPSAAMQRAPIIAHLSGIGELALQRHHDLHQEQPRKSTAPYLRAALQCARELARHAKQHPELRLAALRLTEQVIAAATSAEAACFAAGGNSAPYFAVLITAHGLCLSLADAPAADQPTIQTNRASRHHKPNAAPLTQRGRELQRQRVS